MEHIATSSSPSTSSPEQPPSKRRKLSHHNSQNCHSDSNSNINIATSKWRTSAQQQIYSAALLRALRLRPPSVRLAADKALAVSARGSTRWSRAILRRRRKMLRVRKVRRVKVTGDRLPRREKQGKLPGVERRVKVLSRLVPGCRKVSFPNLLEEASDYIAALEMQVRAMAALADILTRGVGGAGEEV